MPPKEIPQYKCHKVVRAFKITEINHMELLSGNPDIPIVTETTKYFAKHKPKVGGYYVVYSDEYTSFSPADIFEEGYTCV